MTYVIAKYASSLETYKPACYPVLKFSHTFKKCGIERCCYEDIDQAQDDLQKVRAYNPTVDYGVVIADRCMQCEGKVAEWLKARDLKS